MIPTLNDVFPYWDDPTKGLFSAMSDPGEWADDLPLSEMDYELFSRYGDRLAGAIVMRSGLSAGKVTDAARVRIADMLNSRFGTSWGHFRALNDIVYKPLENYDLTESENNIGSDTETPGITETHTHQGSESKAGSLVNEQEASTNSVYGFNSPGAVPSDMQSVQRSNSSTESVTTGDTDTISRTGQDTKAHSNSRSLSRHGNIGVTTSQQMAQSEIDLWKSYKFIQAIMDDVIRFIALPVY